MYLISSGTPTIQLPLAFSNSHYIGVTAYQKTSSNDGILVGHMSVEPLTNTTFKSVFGGVVWAKQFMLIGY